MRSRDRAGERGALSGPETERLSLRAADDDDLAVIASVLQDAVVSIGDLKYISADKLFVMLASRFRWEVRAEDGLLSEAGEPVYERVHCGVAFEAVEGVKMRGLDLKDRGQFLELLTVRAEAGAVILTFAGGAAIRLDVPRLSCHMRDMGEPWPTTVRPDHSLPQDG